MVDFLKNGIEKRGIEPLFNSSKVFTQRDVEAHINPIAYLSRVMVLLLLSLRNVNEILIDTPDRKVYGIPRIRGMDQTMTLHGWY